MNTTPAHHLHILGVCGTFMGGIALLAREAGWRVEGSDAGAWPPMSELLASAGIEVQEGFKPEHVFGPGGTDRPDEVVIGNALSRGNPAIEAVLEDGVRYASGPEWLAREVLPGRDVLAVAGTHGKTTTSAFCTWILIQAGQDPGWLIGGAPGWTERSAALGGGAAFVVEGDEYDTAFFDKRAKLVHYRPHVLILNNLEYDHADIYPDLASIARQLHHAVRTVRASGRILVNGDDPHLPDVLAQGVWSPVERVGRRGSGQHDWAYDCEGDGDQLYRAGQPLGRLQLPLPGDHNRANAAAAVAATAALGVPPEQALEALARFPGVRRRLEVRGTAGGVTVIDDFAHHPTAITATLAALRRADPAGRLLAVLEPRSNTMRMGVHHDRLADALAEADHAFVLDADDKADQTEGRSIADALSPLGARATCRGTTAALVEAVAAAAQPGDRVVVMSNGGFDGFHDRLLRALETPHQSDGGTT